MTLYDDYAKCKLSDTLLYLGRLLGSERSWKVSSVRGQMLLLLTGR